MSDTRKEPTPLYGCCECGDEYSWPAEDLRWHNDEVWCENCYSGLRDDEAGGQMWTELDHFVPRVETENAELRRLIHLLSKRLKAIINVTDRATVEFDDARAALRLLDAAKGSKE